MMYESFDKNITCIISLCLYTICFFLSLSYHCNIMIAIYLVYLKIMLVLIDSFITVFFDSVQVHPDAKIV